MCPDCVTSTQRRPFCPISGRPTSVNVPEVIVEPSSNGVVPEAPYDLVRQMRASILVLGPLVARYGRAKVSLPGGCAIGARPVDQHLKGLESMGASIEVDHGYVKAQAARLRGAEIVFDIPTVTGTENIMMAAALAKGRSTLVNCAREPEVEELGRVLNKMGAHVDGAGTSIIHITGADELIPFDHAIIPDRIEAGTFMAAIGAAGGNVLLEHAPFDDLEPVIVKLRKAGLNIDREGEHVRVVRDAAIRPVKRDHGAAPRLSDGHAGATHGIDVHRVRAKRANRDHLREPLYACSGVAAHGC